MWTLILSGQAHRFVQSLTGKSRRQVENGLALLEQNPHCGKPLKGELSGYWSFRVGIYRMIYLIRDHQVVVEILRIQHRKEVYERLRR